MKAFHLIGLKADGTPVFSCTIRAESLDAACKELRCRQSDPLTMTMEYGPSFAAAKFFAARPYVVVEYAFDGSFAHAVACNARASVPGIDAPMVERSLQKCRRIFLGEAPASA